MSKRSKLFGESLFTTALVAPGGVLIDFESHWRKIESEMSQYCLKWDSNFERQELLKDLQIVLSQVKHETKFYRLRINYSIEMKEYPIYFDKSLSNQRWKCDLFLNPIEFSLDVLPKLRAKIFLREIDKRIIFHCKVGSLGRESLFFLKQNNRDQWNEYLWVDHRGYIQECSRANVFLIRNKNHWVTPQDETCYQGVTRHKLVDWLPCMNIKVEKIAFNESEIRQSLGIVYVNATSILGELYVDEFSVLNEENRKWLLELRRDFFLERLRMSEGKLRV